MNNFEEIFGRLNRLDPDAEDFVKEHGINKFYDDLRGIPEVNEATQEALSYTLMRIGRMVELLPSNYLKEALKIRTAMRGITKELLEEQAEILLNNHIWQVYRSAKMLLGDTLQLGFVVYALTEGVSVQNPSLVAKIVKGANDVSQLFENAVIRYLIKPYYDMSNPKKLPQELIDYFRKLRIERFRYAEAIVRDYENGRILAQ